MKANRLRHITLALVAIILAAAPLTSQAKFRWGPTAGLNISKFHWKQTLVSQELAVGPNVGMMGEIMIPGIGFGVDFAVKYNMHGANVDFGKRYIWSYDKLGNEHVRLHTLDIPVNLRFKWTRMSGFEDYLAPFVYGGPFFDFTLGHNKVEGTDPESGKPVKCLEYPAGCVGLQCGGGVELFKRYQISAGYYWGLTYQIRTVKLDNFSAQPRGTVINFAVLF